MVRQSGRRARCLSVAAALALLGTSASAAGQALHCPLPRDVPRPLRERVPDDQEPVVVPVTGYLLALSWSPHYCAGRRVSTRDTLQCRDGRFGFVLHGLWPQGERASPRWCSHAPRLAAPLIRANLCVSPSAQLVQHQWAKHGTCTGATPRGYLAAARTLFGKLRFPALPARPRVGAVRTAFARTNRWLPARAVAVEASRDGQLAGVRICLDARLRPRGCGRRDGGASAARRLTVLAAARR